VSPGRLEGSDEQVDVVGVRMCGPVVHVRHRIDDGEDDPAALEIGRLP
jgi:hypothetical protein